MYRNIAGDDSLKIILGGGAAEAFFERVEDALGADRGPDAVEAGEEEEIEVVSEAR
jgi:hypothetical protein